MPSGSDADAVIEIVAGAVKTVPVVGLNNATTGTSLPELAVSSRSKEMSELLGVAW